jgi:hypothetical protein
MGQSLDQAFTECHFSAEQRIKRSRYLRFVGMFRCTPGTGRELKGCKSPVPGLMVSQVLANGKRGRATCQAC